MTTPEDDAVDRWLDEYRRVGLDALDDALDVEAGLHETLAQFRITATEDALEDNLDVDAGLREALAAVNPAPDAGSDSGGSDGRFEADTDPFASDGQTSLTTPPDVARFVPYTHQPLRVHHQAAQLLSTLAFVALVVWGVIWLSGRTPSDVPHAKTTNVQKTVVEPPTMASEPVPTPPRPPAQPSAQPRATQSSPGRQPTSLDVAITRESLDELPHVSVGPHPTSSDNNLVFDTCASSRRVYSLAGRYTLLEGTGLLYPTAHPATDGPVVFTITVGSRVVHQETVAPNATGTAFKLDVTGAPLIELRVSPAGQSTSCGTVLLRDPTVRR